MQSLVADQCREAQATRLKATLSNQFTNQRDAVVPSSRLVDRARLLHGVTRREWSTSGTPVIAGTQHMYRVAGKVDENGQSSVLGSQAHAGADRRFLPSVTKVSSRKEWMVYSCHPGSLTTASSTGRLHLLTLLRRWLNVQSVHCKL